MQDRGKRSFGVRPRSAPAEGSDRVLPTPFPDLFRKGPTTRKTRSDPGAPSLSATCPDACRLDTRWIKGGVFTSASYGGGAEYYSVTGMYENPLLETWRKSHKGKGPKGYKRPDESIHDEVCERLTRHPLVDATLMYVEVEGGEVTLTGEVLDRRMKHMAEDIVDEVSGVREIHNKLRVSRDRAA